MCTGFGDTTSFVGIDTLFIMSLSVCLCCVWALTCWLASMGSLNELQSPILSYIHKPITAIGLQTQLGLLLDHVCCCSCCSFVVDCCGEWSVIIDGYVMISTRLSQNCER